MILWVGKVRGSINKVSTKRNTINIYKFITGSLAVAGVAVLGITATTYADDVTELTQVIDAGVLSTDVIDASGNTVANPTITFPVKTQEASVQTSNATYPSGTNRALVSNPGATSAWRLQLQAEDGEGALWERDGGGATFDYNGTAAQGQMTIDATSGTATLATLHGTATGITQQASPQAFAAAPNHVLDILTASGGVMWEGYLTGINISQTIPAGQAAGTYRINLLQTVVTP